MLEFIKKLFQKKDVEITLPKQTIHFAELNDWLNKNTNHHAKSINEYAKPVLEKIEDIIFAAKANMSKLEHAELRNKNISARELELMKGNRASYIKRTSQFVTAIALLSDKEQLTYKDIKHLVETIQKELKTYHDATLKPYAVLQYFFANESYAVAKTVKEIDGQMKDLDALIKKQSVEAVESIQEQIQELQEKIRRSKILEKEKKDAEEELNIMHENKKQAKEKKEKVFASDSYQQYLRMKEQAKEHEKKIQDYQNQLIHSFAVLEKALKKYGKEVPEKEELILGYIEKPVAALEKDEEFKIISVLDQMKKLLEQNTLDIKDDKKDRTLLELNNLTIAFFENFKEYLHKLQEEKKLQEKALKGDVASQHYKEAEYMLQIYNEKADALQKKKQEKEEEITKMEITAAKEQLEKDICSCTKREIEIQLQ